MARDKGGGSMSPIPAIAKLAADLDRACETYNMSARQRERGNGAAIGAEADKFVASLSGFRRLGSPPHRLPELADGLADVAILTYLAAHYLNIDLDKAIAEKLGVISPGEDPCSE
jgi:hypothetical protein